MKFFTCTVAVLNHARINSVRINSVRITIRVNSKFVQIPFYQKKIVKYEEDKNSKLYKIIKIVQKMEDCHPYLHIKLLGRKNMCA